jgi:hypothetical protein
MASVSKRGPLKWAMKRALKPALRLGWAGVALAALAACAGMAPPQAGQDRAALQAQWGPPTGVLTRSDGGTRLEYARGPYGRQTWMVDLDAAGRVSTWEQVLREDRFAQVLPGMSQEALRLWIGRPAQVRSGGWAGGEVWSWRYDAIFCQWFQASLDEAGRVTSAAYGPDPLCDDDDSPLRLPR